MMDSVALKYSKDIVMSLNVCIVKWVASKETAVFSILASLFRLKLNGTGFTALMLKYLFFFFFPWLYQWVNYLKLFFIVVPYFGVSEHAVWA